MFRKIWHRKQMRFFGPLVISVVALLSSAAAFGQTTSFTYQGRLTDQGTPASGQYELEFKLFDAPSAGTQQPQPGPITIQYITGNGNGAVTVTAGVFTVQLDFTASAFPGAARYLEVGVRHPGDPTFTPLSPRQQMTSTPYAIRALSAATADNALQLNGAPASQYVLTGDPRLSDARPPTAGSGNYIQNTTSPQAGSNFNISGNGTVGGSVTAGSFVGNGSGLTNIRTNIYGDGSDGDVTVSGTVDWSASPPAGTLQFHNLTINGALTVPSGLVIRASGIVTISGGGSITVGPTTAPYPFREFVKGISSTNAFQGQGGIAPSTVLARQILKPGVYGGGAGSSDGQNGPGDDSTGGGGAGGGTLVILAAGNMAINGSITANGTAGVPDPISSVGRGGGGAGVIVLTSRTSISNTGSINASGGAGTDGGGSGSSLFSAGGGGGGIVHFLAPVVTQGTVNVSGGAGGGNNGTVSQFGQQGLGGAGGASGGNGGNEATDVIPPQAGFLGKVFITIISDPATLFVP
jgi:hypothetical protein